MTEPWDVYVMKYKDAAMPEEDCTGAPPVKGRKKGDGCKAWRTPSTSLVLNTVQMILMIPVFGGVTIGLFFVVLGSIKCSAEI